MYDIEEKIQLILSIVVMIFVLWFLFIFIPNKWHKHTVRYYEWRGKVNKCVLDMNYRKDCRLILYRENQSYLHNHSDDWNTHSTMIIPTSTGSSMMIY